MKNINPQFKTDKNLRIYGGGKESSSSFTAEYSDVSVIMTTWEEENYLIWDELARAIQMGTAMSDIYIVDNSMMEFSRIMKKEYAYPLNSSNEIANNVKRIYPYLLKAFVKDETICGIPLMPGIRVGFECNIDVWEMMGLPQEAFPNTYEEFLNLIQKWETELKHQYPDYNLFSGPLTQDSLFYRVSETYINHYQREGEPVWFDTPLYKGLIEKILEINIPYNLNVYDELHIDWKEVLKKQSLFQWPGQYGEKLGRPMLLSLDDSKIPATRVKLGIAFINPLSENKEIALAYLEDMMENYTAKEKLYCYTDENKAVPRNEVSQEVATMAVELERLSQLLETAQEAEKAPIEEQIQVLKGQIEQQGEGWEVSPQDVALFEWMLPTLFVPEENIFYAGGVQNMESSILRVMENFMDKAISLDEMIAEIDKRIEMMALEDQ